MGLDGIGVWVIVFGSFIFGYIDTSSLAANCSNVELFTLTYGAIVRQLLTDLEEVEEVNKQLHQMGYNIGIRLIDEFLTKSNVSRCVDFKETSKMIAKVIEVNEEKGYLVFSRLEAMWANYYDKINVGDVFKASIVMVEDLFRIQASYVVCRITIVIISKKSSNSP